ncbi:hypothetical protein EVAR_67528_1 [Eumeta japonica]|uniref:Uncharacterized protein n=1 Tax=Eumeta variegata TaxID=151549 RepID=A0A4C1YXV8_EUMVA|nr:hypothetical protein EVAR_67528_1 [Eumeta japonica]
MSPTRHFHRVAKAVEAPSGRRAHDKAGGVEHRRRGRGPDTAPYISSSYRPGIDIKPDRTSAREGDVLAEGQNARLNELRNVRHTKHEALLSFRVTRPKRTQHRFGNQHDSRSSDTGKQRCAVIRRRRADNARPSAAINILAVRKQSSVADKALLPRDKLVAYIFSARLQRVHFFRSTNSFGRFSLSHRRSSTGKEYNLIRRERDTIRANTYMRFTTIHRARTCDLRSINTGDDARATRPRTRDDHSGREPGATERASVDSARPASEGKSLRPRKRSSTTVGSLKVRSVLTFFGTKMFFRSFPLGPPFLTKMLIRSGVVNF